MPEGKEKYTPEEAKQAIGKALKIILPEEKPEGKYTKKEAQQAMERTLKILEKAPETVKKYEEELKTALGEDAVENLKAEPTEPEKTIGDFSKPKPRKRRAPEQAPPATE